MIIQSTVCPDGYSPEWIESGEGGIVICVNSETNTTTNVLNEDFLAIGGQGISIDGDDIK